MKKILIYSILFLVLYSCVDNNKNVSQEEKSITTKPVLFAINVINIDSISKWYIDNLGFEQLKRNDYPDYNMTIAFLKNENVILELVQAGNTIHKDSVEKPEGAKLAGIMKMGFITNSYEYLYKKLKDNKVFFGVDTMYDEGTDTHFFVVYDNEQNPIQIFSENNNYDESKENANNGNLIDIKPLIMGVFTDSIALTQSWYENNLGFKKFWSKDIPEHKVKVRLLQLDGFHIELLQLNNVIKRSSVVADSLFISGISKITFLTNAFDSLYTQMVNNKTNLYIDSTNSSSDWAKRHFIVLDDNNNLIQIIE